MSLEIVIISLDCKESGRDEKNEMNRKLGTNDNYLNFIVT